MKREWNKIILGEEWKGREEDIQEEGEQIKQMVDIMKKGFI